MGKRRHQPHRPRQAAVLCKTGWRSGTAGGTLWKIHPDQEVRAADKKSMIADAVLVFGNCRDITTAIMLYGSFPAQSDQSGCAVSSGLAFSLWGSTEVLGLPIKIEGNVFYVRGVFKEEEPRLFRQVQAESKEPLSNMQLNFSGTGTSERARQYLSAAGSRKECFLNCR